MRFLVRAAAAAMRTHEALDERDFQRVDVLCRDGARLPEIVRSWFASGRAGSAPLDGDAEGLDPVLLQAMRPFLTRAAEAIMARTDLSAWKHGTCPLCGGEPDFVGHYAGGRSLAHLWPLLGALALPPARPARSASTPIAPA